jgi:hypothetical protein
LFFIGSGHHVLGIMNACVKRSGNGFTSLHMEFMQNIINMYFLKNKMDFANSITFDFNTQTIFNVAIVCPLKAKTPIKTTSPQK